MRSPRIVERFVLIAPVVAAMLAAACEDPISAPEVPQDQPTLTLAQSAQSRYIVTFRDDVTNVRDLAERLVNAHGGRLRFVYTYALKGFAAEFPAPVADLLRAHPSVRRVSDDRDSYVLTTTQTPTPNWGLDRIDQRDPWLDNSYFYDRTGAGVHFYSFDTGIRLDHVELTGRVGSGWDLIDVGGSGNDCHGHGTHTTTIAAGTTFGVAKGTIVHPVRMVGCAGNSSPMLFAAAADTVIAHRIMPAVVNASLGFAGSADVDEAVEAMVANGIVVVAAAGNEGQSACNVSPARATNAITVAASDEQNRRSIFNQFESSNFGTCVDLFAPGSNIRAGDYQSSTAERVRSGTSMSAPHVAGTAGLWLEGFPSSTPATVASKIVSHATSNVIADAQGSPNKLLWMRFANQTPTADFGTSCSQNRYCYFAAYSSVDDVGITEYFWTFSVGYPPYAYGVTVNYDSYGAMGANVTLRVTDAGGRQHSVSRWVSF